MTRIALLAVLAALASAADAASVPSVQAPAAVTALEFDGSRIVYATGRTAYDCNRVYIWNLASRAVTRFGRRTTCEQTSTGNAIAAVSIAGARVLWVHYAGGNIREWSLWTATATQPAPKRLRFVTRDVDDPAPILIGQGDSSRFGDLLPFAVGRTVVVLRANGTRRFSWTAPGRVVALAAKDGELAVASEGGVVSVLDAAGRVLGTETYGSAIDAVRITGDALLVQRGRTLELRRGRTVAIYSLLPGLKLADAEGDRAVLVGGGEVHTFDLGSGHSGLATVSGSLAQLEGSRLATADGRIVSVR